MSSQSRSFLASPEGLKLLQAAKAERGWTFAAIAERAGVSADTVSRLFHPERGKQVSGESARAIAGVLGVEVEVSAITLQENYPEPLAEAEQIIQAAMEYDSAELFISGLGLTTVPNNIANLINLTIIDLSYNQLSSIPEELGQLANLTELRLSCNKLTSIPKELGNLSNLTELYLDHNQLLSIPKELGGLSNLTGLYLNQNQLTSIPEELGKLTKLKKLYLDQNNLASLPKELGKLTNLAELYIHDNNQLNFSREVLGPSRQEISNYGMKATSPQDIFNYYFRLLSDLTPLNEAKLILIGFGAVGKTSLVNQLIHKNFDIDSRKTEGIQITQWSILLNGFEDIKLHVWDFGGQEIMHSTHQFFLTERSLYLLVLNGRQGHEDADAEYWLELIQSFGGSSPVIVVLNKIKEHPFDVNRGALQQKFPNIREFIVTDCETGQGIDQLRAAIERETDALEHLRDPFPASWVAIKDKLSEMAENYISFEQHSGQIWAAMAPA